MSGSLPFQNTEAMANEHSFRQLAESLGAVFRLLDANNGEVVYVSPGYEEIWRRPGSTLLASTRAWFDAIHEEDRERVFDATLGAVEQGGYDEEYRITRPDGSIRWIHDRVCPVQNSSGKVDRIAGIAEDITNRKELEKEVIEISDRERSHFGQDLHDGICQQLVSIAFATDLLRKDLVAKSPGEAVRAARITALLDNAISQARHLSHALCPVKLSGDGLAVALKSLAAEVARNSRISCGAECSEKVFIQEHAVATHLYRITQEAVDNAIKFNNATNVCIRLAEDNDTIILKISDNGGLQNGDGGRNFGIGLSIIKFRTNMAGGRVRVEQSATDGTTIICTFQQKSSRRREAAIEDHFTVAENKPLNLDVVQ